MTKALIDRVSSHIPAFPDANPRRPVTPTDIALVIMCYHAYAVMTVLPAATEGLGSRRSRVFDGEAVLRFG
jgi:hypothetical protein